MILAFGINHQTAPIDVRGQLAISQENIPGALKALLEQVALEEVALLSTCNRTEFYVSTAVPEEVAWKQVIAWWQHYQQATFDMQPYLYHLAQEKAVVHMMRVASGLNSMILGEPQILGQLKSAFRTAGEMGVLGKKLSALFQTSFTVAKKVRATTGIAAYPVSVAFAAVSLAKQIFSDLSQATVLLIGAGENSELILQHLRAKQVKQLMIVNRTWERAEALATSYEATPYPLSALTHCLSQADIVISAISVSQPIIGQSHVEAAFSHCKRRPLFMVDLGVPRNIEPVVGINEDIYLYTVDDLQHIVTENLKNRQLAANEAEKLINHASSVYMDWLSQQTQVQMIRALRLQSERIKRKSLQKALRQLKKGENPENVLTYLAHQLTQRLLHQPTINLRKMSLEKCDYKLNIAKELFSIE